MRGHRIRLWRVALMALMALVALTLATPLMAQVFTGRVVVTAVDSTGAVLVGVNVELQGPRTAVVTTGDDGVARFLDLPPGTYQIKATLQGFVDYLNQSVAVSAGSHVLLKVALRVGGVQEQVDITADTPVIDAKKTSTGTTITLEELQSIPSARDPWAVMQTVSGIVMDRVNVGGSESGRQPAYQAKGALSSDSTWSIDGIPITDMAATGSTPTYYDFDMFQEMIVTTGGADLSIASGGVGLNVILKSGTNTPRGSTRAYLEDESMQSHNMDETLAIALGSPNGLGNRTSQYADYGLEMGAPVIRNRLWAWGSLGKTDVRTLTIRQTPARTILSNRALKMQAQVTQNVRGGFTYFRGNKQMYGRDASVARPPETSYNQTGPSSFYKGEVNFVVGHHVFLTARGSHVPSGFGLQPNGGMDKDVYVDDGGVWHGSFQNYVSDRPQQALTGEGSYFRGTHEIKFGLSWRRVSLASTSEWPSATGNHLYTVHNGYPDLIGFIVSPNASANRALYTSAWMGDTMSFKRTTITAGVRFDSQNDGVLKTGEPAVPGYEQWLPAMSGSELPKAIVWNSLSPRVGVTYSLDEARKTQLRGSYAQFPSQLGNGASGLLAVVQFRYIAFYGIDRNGDRVAQNNELDLSSLAGWSGFDPAHPEKNDASINTVGDYSVPKTHEVIVGVDRELFKTIGVSASVTWRRFVDFNWTPRTGLRSSAYVQAGTLTGGPLPDGSDFAVPYYKPDPAKVPASALTGGREYVTRDGYHQQFWGVEVNATKRLSNRWMARLGFSANDHREYFGDRGTSVEDPTPTPGDPLIDGGLVVRASEGIGASGVYQVLPRYQLIANGLYQGPWGIDIGANVVMRQGFGQAWNYSNVATGDMFGSGKDVALYTDIGAHRLPTVTSMDFRVAKAFTIRRVGMNVDIDVFNVFNASTELGRQYDVRRTGATGFNRVLDIMDPRIVRLGLRMHF